MWTNEMLRPLCRVLVLPPSMLMPVIHMVNSTGTPAGKLALQPAAGCYRLVSLTTRPFEPGSFSLSVVRPDAWMTPMQS